MLSVQKEETVKNCLGKIKFSKQFFTALFFKDKNHDFRWLYNIHDFWKSSCFGRFLDLRSINIYQHN